MRTRRASTWAARRISAAGKPPADAWQDDHRVVLQTGPGAQEAFEVAREELLHYRIYPTSHVWGAVRTPGGRITEGALIVQRMRVGWFWFEGAVRVTKLVDEATADGRRTVVEYATIEGHPERGVATFEVGERTHDPAAWFAIRSWSQPGTWATRLGKSAARRVQVRATRAALERMQRTVGARRRQAR